MQVAYAEGEPDLYLLSLSMSFGDAASEMQSKRPNAILAPVKVAQELDLRKHGVVPVEVKPIAVPQPNGEVKLGAGAADLTTQQIRVATRTAE